MHVFNLSLRDFRNYDRLDLQLESGTTLFYGPNAAGKTTILEALFYLATTRSPRAAPTASWCAGMPRATSACCRLRGCSARCAAPTARCAWRWWCSDASRRAASSPAHLVKTVRVDRKAVRALDLVGNLRVVLFTPADLALVTGAPSERRRYLDVTLSQLDGRYVRTLSHYQKVVQQRNSLLRSWREGRRPVRGANDELAFWDRELALSGAYVLRERLAAVAELNGLAGPIFCQVTAGPHQLVATYQSSVAGLTGTPDDRTIEQAFLAQLLRMRDDEIGRGQTLIGPHRDDLELTMNGISVGTYGSRGQQRSATLALKLGEAELMRARTGEAPVLLLDDLLSELDAARRTHLLDVIGREDQQTLLTATGMEDFDAAFLRARRRCGWRAGGSTFHKT